MHSDNDRNDSLILSKNRKVRKRCIESDEESSSSSSFSHPIKRKYLNALSDYDTGNSTGETFSFKNSPNKASTSSVSRTELTYFSSSDDSVIQPRKLTRKLNILYSSDSSDSGLAIKFKRKRKRIKLFSSTDEDSAGDSCDRPTRRALGQSRGFNETRRGGLNRNEAESSNRLEREISISSRSELLNRPEVVETSGTRGGSTNEDCNRLRGEPSSRMNRFVSSQTTRQNQDNTLANSNHNNRNQHFLRDLQPCYSSSSTESESSTADELSEDSSSADGRTVRIPLGQEQNVIRPAVSRNPNGREQSTQSYRDRNNHSEGALQYESDSSSLTSSYTSSETSSDSDFQFVPIRRNFRRIPIIESDENDTEDRNSEESVTNEANLTVTRTPCKINVSSSSDSDDESDRCSICLIRFTSQEIGLPSSCDHYFCLKCIDEWSKNKKTCPIDRKPFNSITVRSSLGGATIREIKLPPAPHPRGQDQIIEYFENIFGEEIMSQIVVVVDGNEEENSCQICERSDRIESMIFCDSCGQAFHLDCLEPPLRHNPGIWNCSICASLFTSSESSGSEWELN